MSIDTLAHMVLCAFAIIGLHTATDEGMILYAPTEWLFKRIPRWAFKPLFGCPPCMASFWGTLGFVALEPITLDLPTLCVWVAYVCGVSGMNKLIYTLINPLKP